MTLPFVSFVRRLPFVLFAGLLSLALHSPASAQQVSWTFETGGAIYGSPALAGDVLFVGSSDGHLYALDRVTGTELWRFQTEGAVDAQPAVAHGRVYFPSRDGNLYAVNAETGALDWSVQTEGETQHDFWDFYLSDPLILGTTVVFGSGDGGVYALRHDTGERLWHFGTDGPVHAAPIADDRHVYVASFDGGLHALDPRTGQPVWSLQADGNQHFPEGSFQRGPALHDGVLYIGSRDYQLYAVEARTGRVLWKLAESGGWIIATPLVAGDALLYGASDGQRFYAVDRATGEELWAVPVQTRVFGSALMVEGAAVFGGFNGKLMAVDPETGATRWVFQTPASQENFLRVHNAEGELNDEMREMYATGRGREAENRILELGSIAGTPVRHGSTLYFGSTEGVVYALEVGGAGEE